jgi:putative transposase
LVDQLGLLITALISASICTDRDSLDAMLYYHNKGKGIPKKIFGDQGYSGKSIRERIGRYGIELEVVKRREKMGFSIKARRRMVERTFGWLEKFRRLSKDYEQISLTRMSMIYLAMIRLMLKRLSAFS